MVIGALLDPEAPNHADVNAGRGRKETALHKAAKYGDTNICKQLIRLGARVNQRGGEYTTALNAAVASGYHKTAIFLLKEQKADPNHRAGHLANALSAALYSRTHELVEPLLDAGVDVNATDIQGWSAFHLAARLGSWEILGRLMNTRSSRRPGVDKQGRSLLHHAAMCGQRDPFLRVLIDEQMDWDAIDIPDVDGWTPLHWACRHNENLDIIKDLIDCGADFTRATEDGWTPEIIAITHNAAEVLSYIQGRLAETGATSPEDKTESRPTRRKVGFLHSAYKCDGCFLDVCQSPLPPSPPCNS